MQSSLAVDVTHGRLSSHIWRLAWPITTSVALLYLPGIYDTVWLGRLGSAAQAAAGVTMSVRFAMISVLMALSTGGGAVVARYVGAKDQASANLATLQAIMLMTVASGSLGVVGVIFARPLMSLGGADAATLPLAVRYARIIFGGLIPMELVPSIGFMLSAAGAPQVILSMALFSNDTETIEIGVYVLRVLSVGQLAFLMNQVFDAAQTGAGDTTSPMVINLVALWLIQVPLSVLLARVAGLDADGIWLALAVGWIVQMVLMGWWFKRGRWQHKQLL